MTRAERLAAARALYAERKHGGHLAADAPDRLAALARVRPVENARLDCWVNVTDCVCGLTVRTFGIGNHLRGAAHIAGVFRVSVRDVARGIGNPSCVCRAVRRAERRAS